MACAGGKSCKLLAWGKWTDHNSSWVHVYIWNGQSFAQNDADAEGFLVKRLAELSMAATTEQPMPVFARVATARGAAEEYAMRHDYTQASDLYSAVLKRLDSSAESQRAEAERGKAEVHRLLDRMLQSMGRDSEARAQFSQAEAIKGGSLRR